MLRPSTRAAALLVAAALRAPAQPVAQVNATLQAARRAGDSAQHTRALALVDSAAARAPDYPNTVLGRTIALARAGRLDGAAEQLRRLLRWDARYARRALADPALAASAPALRAALAPLDVDSLAERADRPTARPRAGAGQGERAHVPAGPAWGPQTRARRRGTP
jgi:hypothetical protein